MTKSKIPAIAFQESDVYDIASAQCTRSVLFYNHASRNDYVWIQIAAEDIYGTLRGHLPARLLPLLKIRDHTKQDIVHHLAAIQYLSVVNHGCLSDVHGLVTVQLSDYAQEFTIVDLGTILSLAHLILKTEH